MITASSSPNIALIKYWGNRNNDLRLPAADSLSMVIDEPTVTIEIEPANDFSVKSYDNAGIEKPQTEKGVERLKKHWALTKHYLSTLGRSQELPESVSLVVRSGIPPAIGIASSAAIFSCLAEGYAGLLRAPLSREDVSVLGRLGSGSGARNVWGGYVALENHGDDMGGAYARSVATEKHWTLHDIILVPSTEKKKVGSTEGHAMSHSSPLFEARLKEIPRRMRECEDAILTRDFEKLQKISEEDALDMHRVMETQNPPLKYLNAETHRIIGEIEALRNSDHLNVLFTMDAGPTVHLFCTEDSQKTIEQFAEKQKGCLVLRAKTGGGSHLG